MNGIATGLRLQVPLRDKAHMAAAALHITQIVQPLERPVRPLFCVVNLAMEAIWTAITTGWGVNDGAQSLDSLAM